MDSKPILVVDDERNICRGASPDAPWTVLWAETAGMFLGRLEFRLVIAAVGQVIRDFPRVLRARE